MKKLIIIIIAIFMYLHNYSQNCSDTANVFQQNPTSIGMIICSNDTETVWNALRFANYSSSAGDTVNIFLLGKGVELETLSLENQDIKEQVDLILEKDITILGCGTCLQSRKNNEPQVCKLSSLSDLYDLVRKNKIIMTF